MRYRFKTSEISNCKHRI